MSRPVLLVFIALILLSGCTGTGLFQDGTQTPDRFHSSIQITTLADTEVTNNDSGFYFNGGIYIQAEGDTYMFEDLYMCLYDSDTDLVKAHRIGTLEGNSAREVTVESDQQVHYVLIDHPNFQQYDSPDAIRWVYDYESEQYRPVGYQDVSLEYDRTEMVGGCAEVTEA